MNAADVMTRRVISVAPDSPIEDAIKRLDVPASAPQDASPACWWSTPPATSPGW